jgi:hypothetical protein
MRKLIAIMLAVFTVLAHPALVAATMSYAPRCAVEVQCGPVCPCCPAGQCSCAHENESPGPFQPAVPSRTQDYYPVPALPPMTEWGIRKPASPVCRSQPFLSAADRVRTLSLVPLYVQHCTFLL